MTLQIGFWSALGIFFGVGAVFVLGIFLGFKLCRKAINDAIADSAMDGVLQYNDTRFIAVTPTRKPPRK